MTGILHYLSSDPETRKALENERYYREYLKDTFGDLYAKIAELEKKLEKYEGQP